MYNVNDDHDEKAIHYVLHDDDMNLNTTDELLNITNRSVTMMTIMMMICICLIMIMITAMMMKIVMVSLMLKTEMN